MLDKTTLEELKSKLPFKYVQPIQKAYLELYGEHVSRWTVMRFFKNEQYSEQLHNAILDVTSKQQVLIDKTKEVISA